MDDILITSSSSMLVHKLIDYLHVKFTFKKLGHPEYFLGIEIKQVSIGCLLLTQLKKICGMLAHTNMGNAKGVTTPMLINCKLSRHGAKPLSEPHLYRCMVKTLQYFTLTRPNIAFSVNKAFQFMASPLETHWSIVKCIMGYLTGTINHSFLLAPTHFSRKLSFRAYSGFDWVSDPDDRHFTYGSCIFVGMNLVSWIYKKQLLVARSITKAEYCALAQITYELLCG